MKENLLKGAITVILAGAAAYFRQLVGPLIVLAIVMIADYITGMAAAWVAGQLSSRAGVIGIVKKIGYLFAVGVAIVVDYIITFAAKNAGAALQGFHVFGLLVTIWLILNECISILENLSEIGVPLPGFFLAIVKKLKKSTEKIGDEHARPNSDTILVQKFEEGLTAGLTDADGDPYAAFGVSGDLPEDLPDDPAPAPTHPPDKN